MLFPANHLTGAKSQFKLNQTAPKLQHKKPEIHPQKLYVDANKTKSNEKLIRPGNWLDLFNSSQGLHGVQIHC